MKFIAPLLFVLILGLPACGNSTKTSAFCQSVSAVKADVQALKGQKSNPSLSTLETDLKKLNTDVQKAISEAKTSAAPKVSALKTSVNAVKSTVNQIKNSSDKRTAITSALPTLKTQAQAVQSAWKALTSVEKC